MIAARRLTVQDVLQFFIVKIALGIMLVLALVALTETAGRSLLALTSLQEDMQSVIIAVTESLLAVSGYAIFYRWYERREIRELRLSDLPADTFAGIGLGFGLQALFILVIFLFATYTVVQTHDVSVLTASFGFAFSAGFVAGIVLIGIAFRLIEAEVGTIIAIVAYALLFFVLHLQSKGGTVLSGAATAAQAGVLLPAAYVARRSLWFPIFLHFSWDLAEPGIFGAINPSTTVHQGWITPHIAGPLWMTGGTNGPQDSVQSLVLCLLVALMLLWDGKRKRHFIPAPWNRYTVKDK